MKPHRALFPALAAALSALVLASLAGAASAPSVTITSPKDGSSLSAKRTPTLPITGTVAFADSSAQTTTFYLRRDGCGTSQDNPHLSLTPGTASSPDGGDGCGLIVDQVGLIGDVAPQAAFTDYPAVDGMPLALDAGKAITGQISLSGAQVGLAEVSVDLEALVGGQATTIGTGSGSAVLDPTGASTPVPFSVTPAPGLDGADVQALDLRVTIHGPNVYSGFVALNGASYVDVPSYGASLHKQVLVSVDDPSFANPLQAAVNGTTWSLALPTPAKGQHTIYVQATQGYSTSAVATSTFTVKR